jgi:carbon starvation protein
MNSLVLLIIVAVWFAGGYFIYARFLEKKLVKPNNKKKTPAFLHKKSPDYKPSKKIFLFGHHFASIAGAGPIIGPILAVSYFGWFFVVLWILIGTVFIGAIHDYLSLIVSVRHKGEGIAKISKKLTGKRTFYIFSFLLWATLMLIITVFSVSAAQSLAEVPELVIPFFGITLTALLLGLAVYKYKQSKLISSLVALALTVGFIALGTILPLTLPFTPEIANIIWITILFIYALIVSLIPIWIILQPRDYISSMSLFLFLFIGVIGIIVARPEINAPAMISSNFPLWPILFITVACGAASGFHSLVSSGTSSKQIEKESDTKFVGYGAMVAEGFVAILVVIFVSAGLYWTGSNTVDLNLFQNALSSGWIVAFGRGFANIVHSAFSFIDLKLIILFGALIVNIFILTSLDTSTRICRMISTEALPKKFNKPFLLTLLILIPAYLLAITNSYATLWRLFGASNQLIAAVVLIAISAYLVEHKKPVWYTLVPGLFMIVTTLAALFYSLFSSNGYLFAGFNLGLAIISIVLIIFAVVVFTELILKIVKHYKKV